MLLAVRVPPPRVIVFVLPETVVVEEPLVMYCAVEPRVIPATVAEPPVTLKELDVLVA